MDQVLQGLVSVKEVIAYLNQDRYLSLSEAIEYLNLSERTIRKLLPEIKHHRVGSKLLFKKSDLEKWMEKHIEKNDWPDLDLMVDEVMEGLLD